jgi:hypothetical protein
MRKVEETWIGSGKGRIQVQITQLGAKTAMRGFLRVKNVLRSFFAAAESLGGAKTNTEQVSAMLQAFDIPEADYEWLANEFALCTMVKLPIAEGVWSEWLRFDLEKHTAGALSAQVDWLVKSVRLNYADFLGELAVLVAESLSSQPAKDVLPK